MLGKKGVMTAMLAKIILSLLGFIAVSLVFFMVIFPGLVEKTPEELCRNSVVLRTALIKQGVGKDLSHFVKSPLACETQTKEISGNREEIKGQMAKMMSSCWYMFNEARQDDVLDDPVEVLKMLGLDSDSNKCFICYKGLIEEDEIIGGPISAGEMLDYMKKTDHHRIQGLKYFDYIQHYGGPGTFSIMDQINAGDSYGVSFLAKSSNEVEFAKEDVIGGVLGSIVAVGGVACFALGPCTFAAIPAAILGTAGSYIAVDRAKTTHFYSEERDVSMLVMDRLSALEEAECEFVNIDD
jgi:hypothetical protein